MMHISFTTIDKHVVHAETVGMGLQKCRDGEGRVYAAGRSWAIDDDEYDRLMKVLESPFQDHWTVYTRGGSSDECEHLWLRVSNLLRDLSIAQKDAAEQATECSKLRATIEQLRSELDATGKTLAGLITERRNRCPYCSAKRGCEFPNKQEG
jgi:hypothetical protein